VHAEARASPFTGIVPRLLPRDIGTSPQLRSVPEPMHPVRRRATMVLSQKGGEHMTTMLLRSPFRELDAMERRIRPLLDGLSFGPLALPATDVYETEKEFVVELEVPGFEEKELGIEVSDHLLTVTGERHEETNTGEKAFRVRERLEDRFERRFELPREADTKHLRATYGKGLLTVHAPKVAISEAQKVAISKV
jgi:HSP20 family protein